MKATKILLVTVLALCLAAASLVNGQEKSAEEQKMMEMWMKYATPAEGHTFLQKMVGEWDVVSKMWEKPGQEPTITKGPARGKMIFGGRYLKMRYKGTMMNMPFEGMSLHAFDNHLKKYLSIWIDNMGTGIMVSTGTLDKSGKVLTQYAEVDNFITGKKEKAKSVYTLVSPDKFLLEMYMIEPQGEFKSLEVTHTRKK